MYTVCPLFHGLWSFALSLGGSVALGSVAAVRAVSGNPSAGRTFCAVCNSGEFGAGGQPCCLLSRPLVYSVLRDKSACSLCQTGNFTSLTSATGCTPYDLTPT